MNGFSFNTFIGLDFLGIGSAVSGAWDKVVEFFFGTIIYGPVRLLCMLLGYLYSCFEVVAGMDTVEYYGDKTKTLLEVFFTNSTLTKAYWGMALVGIALTFAFTIWAIIKKMFDIDDKVKNSIGQILRGAFKSVLIICSMNLIVSFLLFANSSLLTSVENTFEYALINREPQDGEKNFTDEQYAVMARVINTISNYAMNDSYESRYNVNSCYNDIRADLISLNTQEVFDVAYEHPDGESKKARYWQETLQAIVNAHDLEEEAMLDYNDTKLSEAIISAMKITKTDNSFGPINHFKSTQIKGDTVAFAGGVELDKIILLMGTFDAAKNPKYNGVNASLYDNARGPYMRGDKGYSVYDPDDMYKTFDLSEYNFIIVLIVAAILIVDMMIIIFNCIARIFNMAILYLVFPAVAAASPLDEGGKLKQWTTAFIVQFLGVFGTIIAIHLLVLFFPVIMNGNLVLFDNWFLNHFAKLMILVGAYEAAKKASSMITGILADSAGWQSINAGDMAGSARSFAGGVAGGMASATGIPWLTRATGQNLGNKIQSHLPFAQKDKGANKSEASTSTESSTEDKGSGGTTTDTGTSSAAGDEPRNLRNMVNSDAGAKTDANIGTGIGGETGAEKAESNAQSGDVIGTDSSSNNEEPRNLNDVGGADKQAGVATKSENEQSNERASRFASGSNASEKSRRNNPGDVPSVGNRGRRNNRSSASNVSSVNNKRNVSNGSNPSNRNNRSNVSDRSNRSSRNNGSSRGSSNQVESPNIRRVVDSDSNERGEDVSQRILRKSPPSDVNEIINNRQ